MFISEFSAYGPLDEDLPKRKRIIVSQFYVQHEKYVLGVWVKNTGELNSGGNVIPLYLTQE